MDNFKNILSLFIFLTLLSSCSNSEDFSSLKPSEKLVFGRILYAEKIYEKGDFAKDKPNILEKIGNNFTDSSVKGMLMLCFEIVKEYRDECVYNNTRDLDPRDHLKNKSFLYEGKNLFSFETDSDEIKLSAVSVGEKYYRVLKSKKIKLNNKDKVFYLGDVLIVLSRTDQEGLLQLTLININKLDEAAQLIGREMKIPNGTRVSAAFLDTNIKYETSIRLYK